ncbi:MAG: TPM domain-containing protein, partial [Novosphingobium sp.]
MRLASAWRLVLVVLAGLVLAMAPARAELPPRPDGPVLDQADVIPPEQEAALDQRLRAYNQATGRAVIVATVTSLDGLEDEQYAQELAEAWDIGGATTEEGVLLLVAPNERKLRIHTARGVQERLTDALSGRIIRDTIVPFLRQDDYGGGIAAGVDQIIAQLDRAPADAKAVAEAAEAAEAQAGSGEDDLGSAFFWIIVIVFLVIMMSKRGRRGLFSPGVVVWGPGMGSNSWSGGSGGGGFG